jgi:hypothetical protein
MCLQILMPTQAAALRLLETFSRSKKSNREDLAIPTELVDSPLCFRLFVETENRVQIEPDFPTECESIWLTGARKKRRRKEKEKKEKLDESDPRGRERRPAGRLDVRIRKRPFE